MKAFALAFVAVFALLVSANTAFAFHFNSGFVFTSGFQPVVFSPAFVSPTFIGPSTFHGGFQFVHAPVFTGSVLHPATFFALSTSRITTVPTFAAWGGFRPAFNSAFFCC